MAHHSTRLEVDELGERILPSVTVLAAPANPAKAIFGPAALPASLSGLSGSGQGTAGAAPTRFGVGPLYVLKGTANITGMGVVTFTGSLQAPALNAQGPVTGTLTLTNARGSITVSLTTSSQSGRSALPTSFQYTIVGSSGQFFGSSAAGTMHLTLTIGKRDGLNFSF
jgi:hypothetical protein